MFNGKSILITGGTGSFGHRYVSTLLEQYDLKRLVIYSRDELKQYEMQQTFNQSCMRYFIGDVRDANRMHEAMDGVDYVIPGNDDAIRAVKLYVEAIADACIEGGKADAAPANKD